MFWWLTYPVLYFKSLRAKRKMKRAIRYWFERGNTIEQLSEFLQSEGWSLQMVGKSYVFTKSAAVLKLTEE